jgi:hypothetical protein
MEPPPPPPPPHGATPSGGKSGGLPEGPYDIFIVPPHSSGGGFLYLPSLSTQRNSFLAGVFCTALAFLVYNTTVPIVKGYLSDTVNGGGSGVVVLTLVVGVVAWALGKTQAENQTGAPSSGGGTPPGSSKTSHAAPEPGTTPAGSAPPPQSPPNAAPNSPPPPKSSWQRPQSTPNSNQKSNWERAREETRKREEEKKKAEELKKRTEELNRRREELEKERQKQREKDLRERLERERKERLDKEKELAAAKAAQQAKEKDASRTPSPTKRPPMPSARTEVDPDAESTAYSFRPYDRPKHKANSGASVYSESSYAPSQSTARTTPPPSFTGPYSTKDPDKIVIRGVFSFNNAFMRTPIAQLISGQKPVTDGLILRITTEGLFIDDDRRNEAQREWDVKAWTMKLAEVWCPGTDKISPTPKGADPRQPMDVQTSASTGKFEHFCQARCKSRPSVSMKQSSTPMCTCSNANLVYRAAKWLGITSCGRLCEIRRARNTSSSFLKVKGGRSLLACRDYGEEARFEPWESRACLRMKPKLCWKTWAIYERKALNIPAACRGMLPLALGYHKDIWKCT